MPSFDVVCEFDMQEIDNAVNMVKREIANRYDFRGTSSSITLNKSDNNIVIKGDIDYHLTAIIDMLQTKAISRKISIKTFKYGNVEKATGMSLRQTIKLISGLNKEESKNINKIIKGLKLKVNSQIQGEQIRVTGKKIDDLQDVIQELKNSNKISLPLNFVNMKK